jgi:hypothetical protein
MHFFFLVLDPRVKLKYYKKQEWEQEYIDAAIKIIKDVYSENYRNDNSLHIDIETQENDQNNFFGIFETANESDDEDELEEYLRKPVVNFKTDPLQWWKVSKFIRGFSLMKFN